MVVARRHIISTDRDFGAHYHFLTCSANKEIMQTVEIRTEEFLLSPFTFNLLLTLVIGTTRLPQIGRKTSGSILSDRLKFDNYIIFIFTIQIYISTSQTCTKKVKSLISQNVASLNIVACCRIFFHMTLYSRCCHRWSVLYIHVLSSADCFILPKVRRLYIFII